MNCCDDLSIRLLIVLAMNTIVITSFPVADDGIDGRQLHLLIPASIRGKIFQVNKTEEDASQVANEDDVAMKENDDEGERMNVDEYEGELRNIAESHEAMFRDDKDNSTDVIHHSDSSVSVDETSMVAKNFNSHEKSVEEGSDESMTSNEAISKEPELDTKTKTLLKLKLEEKQKWKRIPTVKKELNSQKEIQESEFHFDFTTDIPDKSRNDDINRGAHEIFYNSVLDKNDISEFNRSQVKRKSAREESSIEQENLDLNADSQETSELVAGNGSNEQNLEEYSPLRRQEDFTVQKKFKENKTNDRALVESLMDLLMKLAENPSHWERAHKLLKDVEDDLKLSRLLESNKHEEGNVNHHIDLLNHVLTIKEPESTTKKSKKKKKKKKPARYQLSTASTISVLPVTTITPMTISSDLATKAHWRVIVDHLFRPSWALPSNNHGVPNIAEVHYSMSSKQLPVSTSQHHIDNSKHVDRNSAAVIDSDDQYPSLGKFYFGKINTHEKGSSENDPATVSELTSDTSDRSNLQLLTYNPRGQVFQGLSGDDKKSDRYNQYVNERSRPFDKEYLEDYQAVQDHSARDISHHHGYYRKPWKFPNHDAARALNTYSSTPNTKWVSKYELRKNSHKPMIDMVDENDGPNGMYRNFDSWLPETNIRIFPWDPISRMSHERDNSHNAIVDNENKNRSKFNDMWRPNQNENDDKSKQKMTMKTWNSLTSNPATWPFKISEVKPWPTDKNGKSFNPNAGLVRKLGLGKQSHNTKGIGVPEINIKETLMAKMNDSPSQTELQNSKEDREIWPSKISSKIQSMGDWVVKPEQSTWKPFESNQRKTIQDSKASGWPEDRVRGNIWNERLPIEYSPTRPSKWKQFSYHKVNVVPITKSDDRSGATQKTRNSFIAMSAVSPMKYPDNEWRKNDIEDISNHRSLNDLDGDDLTTQLLHSPRMMQMNQRNDYLKINGIHGQKETDLLEHQLEKLRKNNRIKRNSSTVTFYPTLLAENTSSTITRANLTDEEKAQL